MRQVSLTPSQPLDWRTPRDRSAEPTAGKPATKPPTKSEGPSALNTIDEPSPRQTVVDQDNENQATDNKTGKLTLLPQGLLLALEPATGDETTQYQAVHILEPTVAGKRIPEIDLFPASNEVTPATFVTNAAAADDRQRQLAKLWGARMQARQAEALRANDAAPRALQLNSASRDAFDNLQPPRRSALEPTRHRPAHRLSQYFTPADVAQADPPGFELPDPAAEEALRPPQSEPAAQPDFSDVTDPPGNRYDELFNEPSAPEQPRALDDILEEDLESELERLERENETDFDEDLEDDIDRLDDDSELAPLEDDELPQQRDEEDGAAAAADDETPACERIYNDRNCCDEEAECQRIIEFIRSNTLDKLSLNTSPTFAPNEDPVEARRLQTEKLAEAPSRTWDNRQGDVVATGRLDGFRYGKIQVRSDSGAVTDIPIRELSRDDFCFVNAWWGLPPECQLGDEPLEIRDWTMTTFTWTASALCHKPLYFEHVELERYGHSGGPIIQPVMSAAHFFGNFWLLPYNMGLHPPNECIYDLGHYRPGSCAPWLIPGFPLHHRAALYQTGAVFGLIGIFN